MAGCSVNIPAPVHCELQQKRPRITFHTEIGWCTGVYLSNNVLLAALLLYMGSASPLLHLLSFYTLVLHNVCMSVFSQHSESEIIV